MRRPIAILQAPVIDPVSPPEYPPMKIFLSPVVLHFPAWTPMNTLEFAVVAFLPAE